MSSEKEQSNREHPSEEQENMEESKRKGEDETTGINADEDSDEGDDK